MSRNVVWLALALSLLGFVPASNARADEWDKKTVLTFSQPFEIPGTAFPAGTYMFKLADSLADRHIVQVFNADGTKLLATVMTIPDYRLTTTGHTVINFREVPVGSPEAIRAWFYPGNSVGQEFVYPRSRATQLARTAKTFVPAMAVDVTGADDLRTVSIVAVTPDEKEMAIADSIQTTPTDTLSGVGGSPSRRAVRVHARQLPQTASAWPFVALLGFASIGIALGLMVFGRRSAVA